MSFEFERELRSYIDFIDDICKLHNWKKDWSRGGCYIHLEVSEFIEALRGKGDPADELGDVLFTIFAVANYYGIDVTDAIYRNKLKHKEIIRKMKSEG